ncbi:MAG: hypothetical protein ACYC1C_16225 [Chloroflexota bacterium]
MRRWLVPLVGLSLALAMASGCGRPSPPPAATASPAPTTVSTPGPASPALPPTPLPTREWDVQDIEVDGSTVTVPLRVFAGIDVRASLDGRPPDETKPALPILEFVFRDVPPGKHTVEVWDVVGYKESVEVEVGISEGTR